MRDVGRLRVDVIIAEVYGHVFRLSHLVISCSRALESQSRKGHRKTALEHKKVRSESKKSEFIEK